MAVKVLFLDYDGVIVDSMGPKAEAIADAFAPYSDDRAAIADGFHRHAGSGREAQFDRIYRGPDGRSRSTRPRAHASSMPFSNASTPSTTPSASSPASTISSSLRRRSGSWPW